MIHDHNIEDFGWYEVGNRRYYNKIHALYDHIQNRLPIHWNVNDDVYAQYQWNQEPTQSLEELYAARARDLRERYDYLVLHFSGGSDSCNILETFIRNRIDLDEIITRGSYSHSTGSTGVVAATDIYSECLTQAAPLAQWAKDTHFPHMKVSVVETSSIILDYYQQNHAWAEMGGNGLTPGMCIKSNIDLIDPYWQKLADRGLKVTHIYGVDKPKIYRHKQNFYTRWQDSLLGEFNSARTINSDHPQYIECFYWGTRAVPLQIKQLHVLKNHIKQHNLADSVFDIAQGRAYENFVASVIYNRTLPLTVEHLKDKSDSIIQDKDIWFAKDQHSDPYLSWQKGVEYISSQLGAEWMGSRGLKGVWSKPYNLGN